MRGIVVSILLFLFLFPSSTFAKSFKIDSQDVNRIDTALDLVKTWGNLVLPDEFKRVLNITVQGTEAGTDISYGLLVLSAVNEMEMIDKVISQRYKAEATKYFTNIMNQQIDLLGYYKGLGFDIARVHFAKNVGGPISALTLNTFDMTNRIIVAILAIHNIERMNFNDGLWRYFDEKRNGSTDYEAWEFAKFEMGKHRKVPNSQVNNRSSSEDLEKIQDQFKDLWEKWGPLTNAFGVKDEIKRQFNEEMRSIVREAADAYIAANAREKLGPSFVQNIQKRLSAFGDYVKQKVAWVTEKTKEFASKIGSFIASLNPSDTGAGLIITILEDKTIIEKSISEEAKSNLSEDKEEKEELPRPDPGNKLRKEPEQRSLQISIPRLLTQRQGKQQGDKEQNTKNSANPSFEGCKDGQININSADTDLLNELAGIGPVKAQSIIDYRLQQGQFFVVNDLAKVSGIGEATVAKVKEQNLACAEDPTITNFVPFRKIDAPQNSETPPPAPGGSAGTPTFLKLLITEVQTAGNSSQTEEFIELYNPNDSQIELHDWYLQKKTQSADEFSSFASKTLFEGEKINAYGYFLIARQGSSFESRADIIVTSSLADNNTLALKNPNGEIADKVGWGSVTDAEIASAQNPAAGKSLSRKYSASYQDTDNNSQDFEEKTPTPKAVNQNSNSSDSGSNSDTTPTVTFNTLPITQASAFFSLGWTGSSANQYFVSYTTSPSTDGVLQYSTTGTWQNWQLGTSGEITLASTVSTVSLTAQDGIEYMFSIKAKNAAGSESSTTSKTTSVSLEKNVVINEIAWAGTKASSSDEWIELYNTTGSSIDLTNWGLQSSDTNGPDIALSGSIGANSFYLIERTDDNPTTETANLTGSFGSGLSNTTCKVLYLYNSAGNAVDQTSCNSDNTWPAGVASPDYITLERINSQTRGSDTANWASSNLITHNGKDAATPANFINGTPKQANSVSLSQTEITNLRFDEFSTLTLTLLGQPYYSNSQITVPSGKTLVVEAGVTVKLKGGAARFEVSGTLSAVGTNAKQIIFATYEPPGSSNIWCGLHFTSTSQNSNLQYVTVEKAGSTTSGCGLLNPQYSVFVESSSITFKNSTISGGNGYRKLYLKSSGSTIDAATISGASNDTSSAAIYIDSGNATITNSTISNNTIGIWNTSSSGTPTISNNIFANNTYPVKLTGGAGTLSGNSATGNTYDAILVEGLASTNITWAKDNIPYLLDTFTVNSGKTLTISAGVVVKFASITWGDRELIVNGGLTTQGTAGELVTFGPLVASGNWKRIHFTSGSSSNLQYTKIENGGNTNFQGALYVKEATLELSNVEIKNSANSAIYGFNATISGSNLTLTDNTYGFLIQTGNCPAITNVTISGGDTLNPSSVSCTF